MSTAVTATPVADKDEDVTLKSQGILQNVRSLGRHTFNLSLAKGELHISFPQELAEEETEEILSMLTLISKRLRRQLKDTPAATGG